MEVKPASFATRHVLATFLFLTLINTASSLVCYTCNSTLDHNCQEMFNHTSLVAKDKMKECNVWEARFCVKVTGLWGGIVGTHRFCSSRNMGRQCQDIWYLDHDRMYRACIYTCEGDGCNSGSKMSVTALSVAIAGWFLNTLRPIV